MILRKKLSLSVLLYLIFSELVWLMKGYHHLDVYDHVLLKKRSNNNIGQYNQEHKIIVWLCFLMPVRNQLVCIFNNLIVKQHHLISKSEHIVIHNCYIFMSWRVSLLECFLQNNPRCWSLYCKSQFISEGHRYYSCIFKQVIQSAVLFQLWWCYLFIVYRVFLLLLQNHLSHMSC